MIFSDGETQPEKLHEDGEIPDEPRRKKSVEFPGINAPIPENADERLWTTGSLRSDSSRYRLLHRSSYSSEQTTSRSYHGSDHSTRWSTHVRDDRSSSYSSRSSLSSRSIPISSPTSASGGSFQSEWDSWKRSSRESDNLGSRAPYDCVPHSYPSSRSFDRSRLGGPWGSEPRDNRDTDYGLEQRDEYRWNNSWR